MCSRREARENVRLLLTLKEHFLMNNLVIRPPRKTKLNYMTKCIYLIAKKKRRTFEPSESEFERS